MIRMKKATAIWVSVIPLTLMCSTVFAQTTGTGVDTGTGVSTSTAEKYDIESADAALLAKRKIKLVQGKDSTTVSFEGKVPANCKIKGVIYRSPPSIEIDDETNFKSIDDVVDHSAQVTGTLNYYPTKEFPTLKECLDQSGVAMVSLSGLEGCKETSLLKTLSTGTGKEVEPALIGIVSGEDEKLKITAKKSKGEYDFTDLITTKSFKSAMKVFGSCATCKSPENIAKMSLVPAFRHGMEENIADIAADVEKTQSPKILNGYVDDLNSIAALIKGYNASDEVKDDLTRQVYREIGHVIDKLNDAQANLPTANAEERHKQELTILGGISTAYDSRKDLDFANKKARDIDQEDDANKAKQYGPKGTMFYSNLKAYDPTSPVIGDLIAPAKVQAEQRQLAQMMLTSCNAAAANPAFAPSCQAAQNKLKTYNANIAALQTAYTGGLNPNAAAGTNQNLLAQLQAGTQGQQQGPIVGKNGLPSFFTASTDPKLLNQPMTRSSSLGLLGMQTSEPGISPTLQYSAFNASTLYDGTRLGARPGAPMPALNPQMNPQFVPSASNALPGSMVNMFPQF